MVTGAAIAAGDVQGMQQQLAARSQVVQAAWEEVQQLAKRLSAGVLNE
jgi:glycerol-3-phosphate dehydrogenase